VGFKVVMKLCGIDYISEFELPIVGFKASLIVIKYLLSTSLSFQ